VDLSKFTNNKKILSEFVT